MSNREVLLGALASSGVPVEQVDERRWLIVLSGETKRTLPVLLELGERTLRATALLTGAPDEGHEAVFRMLLRRNERHQPVHFALDGDGNVVLIGQLRRELVDVGSVDELLGLLLTRADETFDPVLREGFRTYLDAEQRWRAELGLEPNPAGGG